MKVEEPNLGGARIDPDQVGLADFGALKVDHSTDSSQSTASSATPENSASGTAPANPTESTSSDSSATTSANTDQSLPQNTSDPTPVRILGQDVTGITDEPSSATPISPASPFTSPIEPSLSQSTNPIVNSAEISGSALPPATHPSNQGGGLGTVSLDSSTFSQTTSVSGVGGVSIANNNGVSNMAGIGGETGVADAGVGAGAIASGGQSGIGAAAGQDGSDLVVGRGQSGQSNPSGQANPGEQSGPSGQNFAAEFKQSVDASLAPKDSGDIVLGGRKKSKRGVIVGLVIVVIFLIAAIIAGVFYLNSTSKPQEQPKSVSINIPQDTKDLFYSYANEVLYGEDSTKVINEELSDSYGYAYNQKIFNGTKSDQQYLDQINQQYDEFYNQFKAENPNLSSGDLYDAINNYKNLLEFMAINPSKSDFSKERIINVYLEEGPTAAEEEIDDILSEITVPNNQYSETFLGSKQGELENTLAYMIELDENGCIIDGKKDWQCEANYIIAQSEDQENPHNKTYNYFTQGYSLLNTYYQNIGTDCWKVQKLLEDHS